MRTPLITLVAVAALLTPGPVLARNAEIPTERTAVAQARPSGGEKPARPPAEVSDERERRAGGDWPGSFTGRGVPDPTGTRFFKPALSGGTGPRL